MNRLHRNQSVLVGTLALGIVYVDATGFNANAKWLSPDVAHATPQQFAMDLADQLINTDRYSLRADVEVVLHEKIDPRIVIDEPIHGIYEFNCDGDKWRKRSYLDPQRYPGMNTDIAYNGEVYQYCTPEDGRVALSFGGGDERAIGVSLPNPIAALSQFMTDTEVLADTDQPPRVQKSRVLDADLDTLVWRSDARSSTLRGAFPAAAVGTDGLNELVLADSARSPVRIERMNGSRLMQRTIFSDWNDYVDQDGKVSTWPTTIMFESYHPGSGDLVGSIEMTIIEFSVTESTKPFLINLDEMESVWVDQTERFVK